MKGLLISAGIMFFSFLFCFGATENSSGDVLSTARQALESGKLLYRLSEPEELTALLGKPDEQKEGKQFGSTFQFYIYSGLEFAFYKPGNPTMPYVLFGMRNNGRWLDPEIIFGKKQTLVLRNNDDLEKIDAFNGLNNVSLVNCDLRDKAEFLNSMNFDTMTRWPSAEMLPEGFDPVKLLEEGKNPGLGIRELHKKGIIGRGVGVAILDMPLLLGHQEYTSSIVRYDATGMHGWPVRMHGPPIASIAVGRETGVAPGASLNYLTVRSNPKDNTWHTAAIQKILKLNGTLPKEEKIRAISISLGTFSQNLHYDEWQQVLKQAEDSGILVVTTVMERMPYGNVFAIPGKDLDDPASYIKGNTRLKSKVLRIPTGGVTTASHMGNDVYTYWRTGGLSWAAPYIAGVAALACQVYPGITPQEIIDLLIETASPIESGSLINPVSFIARVESLKTERE